MIDYEYTMSTYERVVYELGLSGMTDDNPMNLSDIYSTLKTHFKTISKGKDSFNNSLTRRCRIYFFPRRFSFIQKTS